LGKIVVTSDFEQETRIEGENQSKNGFNPEIETEIAIEVES